MFCTLALKILYKANIQERDRGFSPREINSINPVNVQLILENEHTEFLLEFNPNERFPFTLLTGFSKSSFSVPLPTPTPHRSSI